LSTVLDKIYLLFAFALKEWEEDEMRMKIVTKLFGWTRIAKRVAEWESQAARGPERSGSQMGGPNRMSRLN
jgi:hypothetical protein